MVFLDVLQGWCEMRMGWCGWDEAKTIDRDLQHIRLELSTNPPRAALGKALQVLCWEILCYIKFKFFKVFLHFFIFFYLSLFFSKSYDLCLK